MIDVDDRKIPVPDMTGFLKQLNSSVRTRIMVLIKEEKMVSKVSKNPMCVLLILISTLTLGITDTFGGNEVDQITYPFRIVQISDTQPVPGDEAHYQRAAKSVELVNSLRPDIVIFPGDITHSGTEEEYIKMKGILSKIEAPLYLVPGNHDTIWPADEEEKSLSPEELRKKKLAIYHKYFGPDYWSLEYGDFLFAAFDCTENWPNLSTQRRQWLQKTLLSSKKPYKFIVTHYTHPQTHDTILEHLMTSGEVMGYLHGHNHTIQAYKDAGTERLVFSSGSAVLLADSKDCGVMYFDVNKDSLACFWKPIHGDARPLGVFDLKEAKSVASRRKNALDIGPYLQELGPTEVTIKWQSKAAPESGIKLRKKGNKPWIEKSFNPEPVLHEVKVDDLTPGTKYEFYVDMNTADFGRIKSRVLSFTTPLENSDSVTFAVYGDSRSNPLDHRKVAMAIAEGFADKLDFCIHTGDLVGDGLVFDSWAEEYFNPAEQLIARVPLYPVLGNHERNSDHYFNYFNLPGNERWYSFERGPVHLTCLDSYSSLRPDSDQYNWLKNDLANCSTEWKVVALHTPFFSSGPHGKLNKDKIPAEKEMADLQEYIMPLLEEYGVSMVFSGHDHLYERSKKGDIYYVISGGGGAPLHNTQVNLDQNPYSQIFFSKYHYCIVEATQETFNLAVYDTDGNIIDEVKLTKNEDPVKK